MKIEKNRSITNFNYKTSDGGMLALECWNYSNSYGWGHKCIARLNYEKINECFISYASAGRTWERFKYESIIKKIIRVSFSSQEADYLLKQVKTTAEQESARCDAIFNSFLTAFNNLNDENKKRIQESDIVLNSEEEARALTGVMNLMGVMQ